MNDDPTPAKSTDDPSPAAGIPAAEVTPDPSPAQQATDPAAATSGTPGPDTGATESDTSTDAASATGGDADQNAATSASSAAAGSAPGARDTPAKKAPVKKTPAKKTPAKKATAKKAPGKKASPARKSASKPATATEPTPEDSAATTANSPEKKPAAARPTAKKTATKTTATKKPAAKKTATKTAAANSKKTASTNAKATNTTAPRTTAKKAAGRAAPRPAQSTARANAAPAGRGGRDHDIVVYGATGFVGQLIAKYLATNAPAGVSIALAGRSRDKLRAIRDQLPGAGDWPLIIASTEDTASLDAMAASSKVVLTTVGPYLLHGLPVVEACAKHGTHYTDLTGEVLFMRRSIDAYHGAASDSGARIVHSCGFDSIPSDLGVFALHQAAKADADGALGQTRLGVQSLRGGFSGGTVASLLAGLDAVAEDPSLGRIAADPYGLSPDRAAEPSPGDGNWAGVGWDRILNSWVSPFIMAMVNTRVVRRSNALLGYAYSKDFRYQEMTMNGRGPGGLLSAGVLAGGLAAGYGALNFGPTRQLVERLLPSPGEGPDEESRENGFFSVRLASKTLDGRRYQGLVAAQGDPGYAATAVMIGQCALALALDEDRLPDRAGVLTPATALGQPAIDRLRGAGMTLHAYRV